MAFGTCTMTQYCSEISPYTISFSICTQPKFLNPTFPLSHICLWMRLSGSHIFDYGYCYPEVLALATYIGIQKCHTCLRILSSGIVLFDYGYVYSEGTIMLPDIHIRKPIILNFYFLAI